MATTLKGITVSIGADTSAMSKSLKEVNGTLKSTQSEIGKLNKALKLDPTNTELLATKQKLLGEQVETTTAKLKALKDSQEDVKKAYENGDIGTKEYAEFQEELVKTEASLKSLKEQVVKTGSAFATELGENVKKAGDNIAGVGDKLKGVSAAAAGLLAGSVAAFNVMDDGYDNIARMTGATGEAAQELNDVMDNLYGSLPSEVGDVSNAVGQANTLWHLQGDELQACSEYFLKYADITGTDVVDAMESAYNIQQQFNLTQEETENLMGMIAKGAQDTGASVSDYTSFLAENAAVIQEMNLSTDEAVNLFSQFERAGIDGSSALTGLKKAATNYAEAGLSMGEGLSDLSARLQDASTHDEAFGEVVDLVGTKNALAFTKMLEDGTLSLDGLEDNLGDYANVVGATFDETQDPIDNATIAYHNLQEGLGELGNVLQQTFAPILETLVEKLQEFTEWFKGLDPMVQQGIAITAVVLAALAPVLIIIGTLISSIGTIITTLAPLTAGISALGGTFAAAAAPILAIVAAIAAVGLAINQLWNTNEGFRASVQEAIASVTEVFQNFYDTILAPIFESIGEMVTNIWENGLKPLWDNFVEMIGQIVEAIANFMVVLQPVIDFLIDTFGPVLTTLFDVFSGVFGGVFNGICNIIGVAFNTIGTLVSGIINTFSGIIEFFTGVFSGNWALAWQGIVDTFSSIFNTIIDVCKAPINMVIGFINGMIGGVESGVNAVINAINSIHWDVPNWVPFIGGQSWGFNLGNVALGRIPSLRRGLETVPFDGYIASLHKGERVLTSSEASNYNSSSTTGGAITINQTITTSSTARDQQREAERQFVKLGLGMGV